MRATLPWPSTLRARIFLILFLGLAIAYGLSFAVLSMERYISAKAMMLTPTVDAATMVEIVREGLADCPTGMPVYIRPMYWPQNGVGGGASRSRSQGSGTSGRYGT